MIEISDSAPIRGDIKFLGGGVGTIFQVGASQPFAIGSFDLPAMSMFYKVMIITDISKSAISGEFNTIGTSQNPDEVPASSPGYIKTTSLRGWCQSQAIRSYNTGLNSYNVVGSGSVVYSTDNTIWGDLSVAKKIYVNMNGLTTCDAYYSWAAYLIGSDIK